MDFEKLLLETKTKTVFQFRRGITNKPRPAGSPGDRHVGYDNAPLALEEIRGVVLRRLAETIAEHGEFDNAQNDEAGNDVDQVNRLIDNAPTIAETIAASNPIKKSESHASELLEWFLTTPKEKQYVAFGKALGVTGLVVALGYYWVFYSANDKINESKECHELLVAITSDAEKVPAYLKDVATGTIEYESSFFEKFKEIFSCF